MRTPATLPDAIRCAFVAVASGQASVLGVLGVYFLLARVVDIGGSTYVRNGVPGWYLPLASVVALLTVAAVWMQWRRGDLDTYEVRRRRQPR